LVFDHQISDNLCYSISVPDSSGFDPLFVETHDALIILTTNIISQAKASIEAEGKSKSRK
jgi:hypothetical protein